MLDSQKIPICFSSLLASSPLLQLRFPHCKLQQAGVGFKSELCRILINTFKLNSCLQNLKSWKPPIPPMKSSTPFMWSRTSFKPLLEAADSNQLIHLWLPNLSAASDCTESTSESQAAYTQIQKNFKREEDARSWPCVIIYLPVWNGGHATCKVPIGLPSRGLLRPWESESILIVNGKEIHSTHLSMNQRERTFSRCINKPLSKTHPSERRLCRPCLSLTSLGWRCMKDSSLQENSHSNQHLFFILSICFYFRTTSSTIFRFVHFNFVFRSLYLTFHSI